MAKEKPLRGAGASHKHHGDVRQSQLGSQQRHLECRQMEDGNTLVSRKQPAWRAVGGSFPNPMAEGILGFL